MESATFAPSLPLAFWKRRTGGNYDFDSHESSLLHWEGKYDNLNRNESLKPP